MGLRKAMFGGLAGVLVLSSSTVFANDLLIDTLAEKGIITYGEAQQIKTESREETRKLLAKGQVDTLPAWIQNISMKGDLRLRQQTDWSPANAYPRIRQRLRLRAGFDTRIVDGLKAGFGLATGQEKSYGTTINSTGTATDTGFIADGEPTSTNWTFGYGFAKPVVMIDFAFLEYEPFGWMKATAGKMKAGVNVWNTSDLLWDTDINPDGLALTFNRNLSDKVNVFLTGSWATFNGDKTATTATPGADVYIAQPGVVWKPSATIDLKAAVAWQQFNVKGKNMYYYQGVTSVNGSGNPTFGTATYDYKCINPSISFLMRDVYAGYIVNVFSDMVQNTDSAVSSDNRGASYGLRIGDEKITKFGEWQLSYAQRGLQTNAWPNKLGDSDAYGGSVNSSGYEAIGAMGLTPSTVLTIDWYNMDKINAAGATTPAQVLQFDVVYKF